MSEQTPFNPEANKLPSGLNVLTILTFIGCATWPTGLIATVMQFFGAKKQLEAMEEVINSGKVDEMPSFARGFYSPEMLEQVRISYENRLPLFIISLVSLALCFYGALQMRKLKKQGYLLYVIGQALPFIGSIIFIGFASVTSTIALVFIGIVGLFVLLYTLQRKYLVHP